MACAVILSSPASVLGGCRHCLACKQCFSLCNKPCVVQYERSSCKSDTGLPGHWSVLSCGLAVDSYLVKSRHGIVYGLQLQKFWLRRELEATMLAWQTLTVAASSCMPCCSSRECPSTHKALHSITFDACLRGTSPCVLQGDECHVEAWQTY